jgi:hypothetical protein
VGATRDVDTIGHSDVSRNRIPLIDDASQRPLGGIVATRVTTRVNSRQLRDNRRIRCSNRFRRVDALRRYNSRDGSNDRVIATDVVLDGFDNGVEHRDRRSAVLACKAECRRVYSGRGSRATRARLPSSASYSRGFGSRLGRLGSPGVGMTTGYDRGAMQNGSYAALLLDPWVMLGLVRGCTPLAS